MEDVTLLRRYAETRDEAAFTALVQRHLDGVYSVARRRVGGDAQLAEDVSQQVFLAMARDAKRLSTYSVLTGWLYLATRNASANVVRSERRRKAREQEIHTMQDILWKGPAEADWTQLAPVIETAVDQLRDDDRIVVLLRFVERRTFGQMASVLRLTEDAARKRLERALDKLRSILARRGIDSSAAVLATALATNAVTAAPSGLAAAVASAAITGAVGGAGLTIFTIMSMTKIQMGVAAALVIASAGGILVLQKRNAALGRELTALHQQYGRLQARAEEPIVSAVDPVGAGQETAGTIAPTVDRSAQPTATRLKGVQLALAKQRDRRLAELDQQYPKLYSILRLTPEQAAQLRSLIAANIQRNTDLLAAAVTQSGKLDDISQKAADQISNPELGAMLQATFGDATAQTVLRFGETLPMRANVEGFAIRLLYSDLPLSESQAEQLVNIVYNNRVPPRIARPAGPDGMPETDPVKVAAYEAQANAIQSQAEAASYQGLIDRAGTVLSPAQHEVWRQMINESMLPNAKAPATDTAAQLPTR